MKDLPLVSVGIITYNQKEYLKECIESILEQDYPNIEIVIGDDGSTDGTQEMLKAYDKKFPGRFKLILSKNNEGITKNQNKVVNLCKGKYIAWMGGDDLMLPGKIKKQVEYMDSNPNCVICYHNLEVFDSDTGRIIKNFNDKSNSYEGDIRVSIKYGTFNGACSNMVRNLGVKFNESVPVASDWLYWIDILSYGGTINYVDKVLGKYRRHDNNVTKKTNSLTQNETDHLNTINILIMKYPKYIKEIKYRASNLYKKLRLRTDYFTSLRLSLAYKFNIKSSIGLIVYLISLKNIKL